MLGILGRVLDFVPGYTNGFRDRPGFVRNGMVFCCSGRVLDIATGNMVERKSRDEIESLDSPKSDARYLYNSSIHQAADKVRVGDLLLSHPSSSTVRDEWSLIAETESGKRVWEYSIRDGGRHINGNYYSYRLCDSFIYLVVSEEPQYKPHPSHEHMVVPNPTRWAVLTLDVLTGKPIQEISLDTGLVENCRIEDVDAAGLLVGKSNRELMYFARRN